MLLPNVTVIIPTLNASRYIEKLFPAIFNQDYEGSRDILVIDSNSNDGTADQVQKFSKTRLIRIRKQDFTHGYARNLGVQEAKSEMVVFLSQDACPYNNQWLENLVRPLIEEDVAASYSRQIPYENATPMEVFFIRDKFPNHKKMMQLDSSKQVLGLLDVFFSNVSSAAKRSIALQTPFQEDLIMSEDQQFSRDVIKKGYRVSYEPTSIVWHSHRYDLKTIFQRYFDSAYSLTCIFDQDLKGSFKIGLSYYFREIFEMIKHPLWLPYYFFYLTAKTAGALAGHYAEVLPHSWMKYLSMHKAYWEKFKVEPKVK